jgi:hypothetical protein
MIGGVRELVWISLMGTRRCPERLIQVLYTRKLEERRGEPWKERKATRRARPSQVDLSSN